MFSCTVHMAVRDLSTQPLKQHEQYALHWPFVREKRKGERKRGRMYETIKSGAKNSNKHLVMVPLVPLRRKYINKPFSFSSSSSFSTSCLPVYLLDTTDNPSAFLCSSPFTCSPPPAWYPQVSSPSLLRWRLPRRPGPAPAPRPPPQHHHYQMI